MKNIPQIALNDSHSIPQLGYGLWQVSDDETASVVVKAIEAGYRSIDSAQVYQNEAGLGRAVKNSPVPRTELFLTTKIWNSEQGEVATRRSFDVSMKKLALDYVDLLLIHWPAPRQNKYIETWKTLVSLKKEGRVRSIGVSNFYPQHLREIIDATGEVPVLNQVELHPHFQQRELVAVHKKLGIQTECWSPLGQGKVITDPTIGAIAKRLGKTPGQVILRWHLDMGYIAIPKTTTPSRIVENISLFDFKLSSDDHALIAALDRQDGRVGPDPMTANF